MVDVKCAFCKGSFKLYYTYVKLRNFCTRKCFIDDSRKHIIYTTCLSCSKKCRTKKFCSKQCIKDYQVQLIVEALKTGKRKKVSQRKIRQFVFDKRGIRCEECDNPGVHNEKPLVLQLHHKDGKTSNWKDKNLQILCPNCHTQTDNFGSKNVDRLARLHKSSAQALHACGDSASLSRVTNL